MRCVPGGAEPRTLQTPGGRETSSGKGGGTDTLAELNGNLDSSELIFVGTQTSGDGHLKKQIPGEMDIQRHGRR